MKVLKLSGICGILAPILTFTFIFLAMSSFQNFDWSKNALSDLAGENASTQSALLFNSGLIIGGILTLIFAVGLKRILHKSILSLLGAFIFIAGAMSLCLIGVFPETAGKTLTSRL